MTPGFSKRWARAALALAGCALLVASARGQISPFGGASRAMVNDAGLPGIDRGLRDHDRPREPRGRQTHSMATIERADGVAVDRLYRAGSVIVKFRDGSGQEARNSAMRDMDAHGLERPSYADFEIMEIAADADAEAICADLRARPDVEYAQPRYLNYPMLRPNDQHYDQQWNFPAIDMERAWDIQPDAGSEIVVAVLDSGVAFDTGTIRYESRFPFRLTSNGPRFPALGLVDVPFAVAPELGDGKFVAPHDFIWNDDLPVDLDGHGTHVSGTVGQLTNNNVGVAGMAYNVRIMPVKVVSEVWDFIFGSPEGGTDDVVARGIRYAADNGAHIINMSFGRSAGGPAHVVEAAIRYAIGHGVFVAVAAGNTADSGNAGSRTAEAAPSIQGMVAVGAVGRALERSYYSTTNIYVEIAAPGGDMRRDGTAGGILQQTIDQGLLRTFEGGAAAFGPPRADAFTYEFFQGTSMATPHVSAFAALLMQQGITSPQAIEAAMKQFARDLGREGVDSEYGHGLIQPRTTLRGLGLAR